MRVWVNCVHTDLTCPTRVPRYIAFLRILHGQAPFSVIYIDPLMK